jgi:hypothetical protein
VTALLRTRRLPRCGHFIPACVLIMETLVRGRNAFGVGHRIDRGGSRPRLDQTHFTVDLAAMNDQERPTTFAAAADPLL